MLLEVCANSVQSAINAERGGADRIELCRDLTVGGVTPSLEELTEAREKVDIPIFVLVRSRAGDFVYTASELDEMEASIKACKQLGYEGVVIGALTSENEVDILGMQQLIAAAEGMKVTFHRAFDEVEDHRKALEELKGLSVDRVLTSGLANNALAGREVLTELVELAKHDLVIMPGGGVRPENIEQLLSTSAKEFHSSCIAEGTELTEVAMVRELKRRLK